MSTDDKDELLSPEEVEVDNILQEATKRLEEIDYYKNNLPPLSGPKLVPPGFTLEEWTPAKREYFKKTLEYRSDTVKAQAKENAVKAIEKSPLNVQLKVYQTIDDWAEPKIDRDKNLTERTSRQKEISNSQDVAMLWRGKEKGQIKNNTPVREPVELSEPATPQEVQPEPMKMSGRFHTTLHYNNWKGPTDGPDKSNEGKDIDKED